MRLRISLLICALVWSANCFAEPVEVAGGIKAEKDIAYVPDGDRAQKLDIYWSTKESDKPLPLIVYIHGGGWRGGSKSGGNSPSWVRAGYVAASVEYRFSDKALFPAQLQDCKAAIRWLRANSKKYNIDPDHIGIWGDSAGGHLVALLGTTGGNKDFAPIGGNQDQSDRVQAVCDWYGPIDFNSVMKQAAEDKNVKSVIKWNTKDDPYSDLIGVELGSDKAKGEAVSPIHYVSKDAAPILIFHGTKDALVPLAQSEEFVDALKAAGADVLLQKFPGSGHGGEAFYRPAVRNLMQAFFDKHLKGADVKVEILPDSAVEAKAK